MPDDTPPPVIHQAPLSHRDSVEARFKALEARLTSLEQWRIDRASEEHPRASSGNPPIRSVLAASMTTSQATVRPLLQRVEDLRASTEASQNEDSE